MAIANIDDWDPSALTSAMANYREEIARSAGRWLPVLKLHCSPANLHRAVECTNFAYTLGFAHVIIDPPWSEGLEPALDFITDTINHADIPATPAPWWQEHRPE
jgi:hypothetical protein